MEGFLTKHYEVSDIFTLFHYLVISSWPEKIMKKVNIIGNMR